MDTKESHKPRLLQLLPVRQHQSYQVAPQDRSPVVIDIRFKPYHSKDKCLFLNECPAACSGVRFYFRPLRPAYVLARARGRPRSKFQRSSITQSNVILDFCELRRRTDSCHRTGTNLICSGHRLLRDTHCVTPDR